MPSTAVHAYFIVLVIVMHEGRFLMIREAKHGGGWYLPAGRVEPGESLVEAAVRETMEEAGVRVKPAGIVHIDQSWGGSGDSRYTRLRYGIVAHPVGSTTPKSVADEHSIEARWVALSEAPKLHLRGDDVLDLFALVDRGGPILPMDRYLVYGG